MVQLRPGLLHPEKAQKPIMPSPKKRNSPAANHRTVSAFKSLNEQRDDDFFFLVFSDCYLRLCLTGKAGRHLNLLGQKSGFQLEGCLLVLGADGNQIAFQPILLRIFLF